MKRGYIQAVIMVMNSCPKQVYLFSRHDSKIFWFENQSRWCWWCAVCHSPKKYDCMNSTFFMKKTRWRRSMFVLCFKSLFVFIYSLDIRNGLRALGRRLLLHDIKIMLKRLRRLDAEVLVEGHYNGDRWFQFVVYRLNHGLWSVRRLQL